jgi:hypothetical protein
VPSACVGTAPRFFQQRGMKRSVAAEFLSIGQLDAA